MIVQARPAFRRCLVYINELKKIRTKKGEQMAFLTVSDQSGEMEVVVFPNVLKSHSTIIQKGKIILIQGKIEARAGKDQMIMKMGQEIDSALEPHRMS